MTIKLTEASFGKKDEMAAAIEMLKRQLPLILEHTRLIAEIRKASYDAHLAQGFTEPQALELCKSREL